MYNGLEKADVVEKNGAGAADGCLQVLSYTVSDEKKEIYTVSLNNGAVLDLTAEEFFENSMYDSDIPLSISFDDLIFNIYSKRAFYESVRFVLFAKKTVSQVRDHLTDLGYDESCIEFAVNSLKEEGYLDDFAYAKKFIKKAVDSRIVSCRMIICELKQKGITEEIVRVCLDELDIDDYTLAQKAVAKKKTLGVTDTIKIRRFLAGKGFSGDAVRQAIGSDIFDENI
ncbi:MAG: RecX family transcriptional regulator [Clostridia bacterium]|nr:RecX family transcriptional regulator [Clostridia bacterium]